jgi:hypothetical protein
MKRWSISERGTKLSMSMGALDLDGLKLLVLDEEELVFADLVASGLLRAFYGFTGFLVDELLAQSVASPAVDLAKRNPLRG